jgi:hypothetical protein
MHVTNQSPDTVPLKGGQREILFSLTLSNLEYEQKIKQIFHVCPFLTDKGLVMSLFSGVAYSPFQQLAIFQRICKNTR